MDWGLERIPHLALSPIPFCEIMEMLDEPYSDDPSLLYTENSKLIEDISNVCDRKKIMKIAIPNYKLFASFNILVNEGDIKTGGQYLSSRDRLVCEQNVYEHLVENKEGKRIK